MPRAVTALLLTWVTFTAVAGDIEYARVAHKGNEYSIDVSVRITGDQGSVYRIVTDYEQLHRLSDIIIESVLIDTGDPEGTGPIRRRVVTSTCILFFCIKAVMVEDVTAMGSEIVRTALLPEHSDFRSGTTEWHILKLDDTHTLLRFHGEFEPDFWIPPVIGPILIKKKMLNATRETILKIESIAIDEQIRT